MPTLTEHALSIATGPVTLAGDLCLPADATALVIFAHGSGSSRFSPRNRHVARLLNAAGLATVLVDLLTEEEEVEDERTRQLRFDIGLLARRLEAVSVWLSEEPRTARLRQGCFGASTGAGAALVAAARQPALLKAVVSRGGRPDLACEALARVVAPTLLIVGGEDVPVIVLNRRAQAMLCGDTRLDIVPGATHLFEEPGALDTVAAMARDWFLRHLAA